MFSFINPNQISLSENIPELQVKMRTVNPCDQGLCMWAGPAYLRQAHVPGQQQDEE